MKRSLALGALVLAVAIVVTGCGGGGAPPASTGTSGGTTSGATAAPPAPPTAAAPSAQPGASETRTATPFTPNNQTPAFFRSLIELKTPVVALFYSKQSPANADVQKEFATVQKAYANQAEFVKIDMDQAYNIASLPTDKQQKAQEIANLATQLGVKFTPHVVIIDRGSMITYTNSGYFDAKTLEQELFKALKR